MDVKTGFFYLFSVVLLVGIFPSCDGAQPCACCPVPHVGISHKPLVCGCCLQAEFLAMVFGLGLLGRCDGAVLVRGHDA